MYVRGISNGIPFQDKFSYEPYLFLDTKEDSIYKNVKGGSVKRYDFNSPYDAKEFIKKYDDVEGINIYGVTKFQYTYIYDNYPGDIKYRPKDISTVGIDIENSMKIKCDIPTAIQTTPNEITSITISKNGKYTTFSLFDDYVAAPDVTYYKCVDEWHLLKTFLMIWNSPEFQPDVITGWNIEFYDIPYLVNRMIKILGQDITNQLSPWGLIRAYDVEVKGKTIQTYELRGITTLDYMQLYKKFILRPQEKYSLDHIALVELNEQKIDYKTKYGDLDTLLRLNPQLYIDYNIHDVRLVDKLEHKLKLIELVFAIAYVAKVNYVDALSSVGKWDILIHNYLMDRNIVVDPMKAHSFNQDLVGGYVKDPITGMHQWVVYLDLTSLYPHLIMGFNISTDTFVKRRSSMSEIDDIVKGVKPELNENSLAANGCEYSKDKQGFLPAIMQMLFDSRKTYKNKMLDLKQEEENIKRELEKRKIKV